MTDGQVSSQEFGDLVKEVSELKQAVTRLETLLTTFLEAYNVHRKQTCPHNKCIYELEHNTALLFRYHDATVQRLNDLEAKVRLDEISDARRGAQEQTVFAFLRENWRFVSTILIAVGTAAAILWLGLK